MSLYESSVAALSSGRLVTIQNTFVGPGAFYKGKTIEFR